ncbi:DUF1853 family protein [Enterovibrio sp. ZSDZ42]|uniref:DUF1853 family protein n=1 Tax=Enterovibrio gelatinilyticus TaxID=2899819 RepID=A0ABT5QYE9_9GAMM|nr:DUF1853 family protein [Enterovibrio sp. ZSDZ42]MDD1792945.1 DUF1853 family protein [Enterovibrio sp. ZSDZ42]
MFADEAQVTRDIEWISSAPPIVQMSSHSFDDDFWSGLVPAIWPGYTGGHRIGFYYQWLVCQCIESHPKYQLVTEEIQVTKDGRTLGAIDFVVKNPAGELEHWEVAIKFYLAFGTDWHGPNAKDTLAKKYEKMAHQQLQLSESEAYQTQYPELPIKHRKLLMQGRLYTNPFILEPEIPFPSVTAESVSGYWCWPSQLPEDLRFYHLQRHQWLEAPRFDELEPFALELPLVRAQHIIDENGKRWFVVPESWPNCH